MITLKFTESSYVLSSDRLDLQHYLTKDQQDLDIFRQVELATIRKFVSHHATKLLHGLVLDFGCGKEGTCRTPQPYRNLVGGEYIGVDVGDETPLADYDAILCTQVLNYMPDGGAQQLRQFHELLRPGGWLVCTYATNWEVIEEEDLCRLTKKGMDRALTAAGFKVVDHELRFQLDVDNFRIPIGYGVTARAAA